MSGKKPFISLKDRLKHLQFPKTNINWTIGSGSFGVMSQRSVSWNLKAEFISDTDGEEMKLQCLKPIVKEGSGSINVWNGFSMHGVGPIHKINDIIDQIITKNIMKDVVLPY